MNALPLVVDLLVFFSFVSLLLFFAEYHPLRDIFLRVLSAYTCDVSRSLVCMFAQVLCVDSLHDVRNEICSECALLKARALYSSVLLSVEGDVIAPAQCCFCLMPSTYTFNLE